MKIGTSTVTAIYLGTTSIVSAYLGATQVFGGSFTPLSLFSGGAQGIWLDPSDLSTMFSDRAGTTAVTTPGTVVGLRLDKSKGLALGAELVTNGDFATDLSGWTTSTFAWSDGTAVGTATNPSISQAKTLSAGKTYEVRIEASNVVGGSFGLRFSGGTAVSSPTFTNGSHVFRLTSTGNTTLLVERATGTVTSATIDNISVRELAGNHAVAPTDAARPVYGVEPKGGRRNLLTQTELFSDAAWSKSLCSVTDQGGGVWRLQAAAGTWGMTQSGAFDAELNFSVEVKTNGTSFNTFRLRVDGTLSGDITATAEWQRYNFSATHATTGINGIVRSAAGNDIDVLIRFPQLELGSTATAYQRVLSAYDVTESGVATTHYVQYDGSDDSMSTAAIDFTATDKMSVFAGVRKLSDAATGVALELSSSLTSNTGAVALFAPVSAGATFTFGSKGSVQATATSPATFAAPTSNVLTGIGNISGDTATLRANGTQVAQVTSDQGTGNFGNYPMFIGRRNNATLPFNGRDYGIIVVGKAASAGEITDTETWLAAKTSGVTL